MQRAGGPVAAAFSIDPTNGGLTSIVGRGDARLTSRNQQLAHMPVGRWSTLAGKPACPRGNSAGHGFSIEGPRQEKLWGQWHMESQEVLWLNSLYKQGWVGWQLAALDMDMGCFVSDSSRAETVSKLCGEGKLNEAVEALGLMVQTECCISKPLMFSVLRRCVVNKEVVLGRRLHAFIVKKGYESDTFLCNHILRMYSSHGRLQDAMDVFEVVARPDALMWGSIIHAHVKHGQSKQAVELYHRMCRSSVKPNGQVFVTALQACARAGDLRSGQQVHADVMASGSGPGLFVGSCLVHMYAKCGSLEDAQSVFDGLGQKNVVTWNAMIAGYSQHGKGQEAFRLYRAMQEDSMAVPDSVTFVSLLQACASMGHPALEKGKDLHGQIRDRGLQADLFIANSLVNMYAKCGGLEDAERLFDGLGQKDVVTWTAMIAGYSQQGMGQQALRLYSAMEEEGIAVPNSVTFACLLQACASVGILALEKGKQIHAQTSERGHEADLFVTSSLVNMYAKCGSLEDAQRLFDGLGKKNVVTWTAMIAAYSQQGMGHEALHLYGAMEEEGISVPDAVTFVCLLQACASVGPLALGKGKHLHAQIRERGHQADVFVANSLITMYAKCGNLEDAQSVFDGLGQKDVLMWNALIAGYSQRGLGQEALRLYSAMQEDVIVGPDSVTFVCLLQACVSVGTTALEKGKQLHAEVRTRGYESDLFVVNSLVNMYAKCGSMEDAQTLFDRLGHKDVVTWNAMIAGYSQQGMGEEALHLYIAMQEEGIVVPDSVTFVCLLEACASVGTLALETGKQLHIQIRDQGHEADVFVASSLVNMYAKCGSLEDSRRVFDGLDQKSVVTWTAMIAAYAQQGMGVEALHLYSALEEEGMAVPNSVTFVCLLQACASIGTPALEKGKHLHGQIRKLGHQPDEFVANSLVHMYAKCGSLEDAQRVFDQLGHKDVVTWNALIAGYSQQGMGQEALRLYRAMQEDDFAAPDAVTYVCLLQSCAKLAALYLGRQLHARVAERGLQSDVFVAHSLINMYGKSGSMVDAQQVFDGLNEREAVAWNALIAGYTCQGDHKMVFDLVERMKEDGLQPVGVTFLSVLTVCSHAGLVNKGREYFQAISTLYGITPTNEHYTCMVDILGRAGQLDEALAFVRTMPVLPNAAVWRTLLGACRKWSNVEVGLHAFHEAVKLDTKDAAAYVLMLNIYITAQMWEQAQKMQARRNRIRAWKLSGQSWWTGKDGVVHSFLVGDENSKHPRGQARLKQLLSKRKKEGDAQYVNSSALEVAHDIEEDTGTDEAESPGCKNTDTRGELHHCCEFMVTYNHCENIVCCVDYPTATKLVSATKNKTTPCWIHVYQGLR